MIDNETIASNRRNGINNNSRRRGSDCLGSFLFSLLVEGREGGERRPNKTRKAVDARARDQLSMGSVIVSVFALAGRCDNRR